MRRASSASATWRASRSASEYTATVRTPMARAAVITRQAISPRLAIRILRNMSVFRLRHADRSQIALYVAAPHRPMADDMVTVSRLRRIERERRLAAFAHERFVAGADGVGAVAAVVFREHEHHSDARGAAELGEALDHHAVLPARLLPLEHFGSSPGKVDHAGQPLRVHPASGRGCVTARRLPRKHDPVARDLRELAQVRDRGEDFLGVYLALVERIAVVARKSALVAALRHADPGTRGKGDRNAEIEKRGRKVEVAHARLAPDIGTFKYDITVTEHQQGKRT